MAIEDRSDFSSTPFRALRVKSVREANAELVLKSMNSGQPVTRADLAEKTSLTPQALGPILAKLIDAGLVTTRSARRTGPGRPPTAYVVDPGGAVNVTFLLGFVDLFVVAVNALGERLGLVHLRHSPAASPAEILDRAFAQVQVMLSGIGIEMDRLASVEVVLEGRVDEAAQIVHETPSWTQRDVDLRVALEPYLPPATQVTVRSNDRTAAVRALKQVSPEPNELVAIIHVGHHNHLFLALGSRLLTSRNGRHGNLTHVPVRGLSQKCECERLGCLGLVSSGRALIATYADLTGQVLPAAVDVMGRVSEGDPDAVEAARRWSKWLAVGIGPILSMIDPDRVIVTGAIGQPSSRGVRYLILAIQAELPEECSDIQFDVITRPAHDLNLSALRSDHLVTSDGETASN